MYYLTCYYNYSPVVRLYVPCNERQTEEGVINTVNINNIVNLHDNENKNLVTPSHRRYDL